MPQTSSMESLIANLDAALPQTQCTRCGYPRCRDYAAAMVADTADLNRCPPGGDPTIRMLSTLLGRSGKPLDPACGTHEPRTRAVIDEAVCIGCRKCLDVCPVDAIVGARKRMHTVIAAECNGCGLCLPPCPVDCIALIPESVQADPDSPWPEYTRTETGRWRLRTAARLARMASKKAIRSRAVKTSTERERIRHEISAAVARVRARRAGRKA
jgi:electron transport complex protein RnfB